MMGASSVVCLVLLLFVVSSVNQTTAISPTNPVLLVPGLGGSLLYADAGPNWGGCQVPDDYAWVDVGYLVLYPDCLVQLLTLLYDRHDHTTHDPEGLVVETALFGSTYAISDLDPDSLLYSNFLQYYQPMIDTLVQYGYAKVDIGGAPYDFRKAPNEMEEFYTNLTSLIEDLYSSNNNMPVVVIGHSMGNPVLLHFYNQMSQAWKDRYIKAHVSLAGVWGGTAKVLHLITAGYNMGVGMVPSLTVRPMERAMVSVNWFMPSDRFWKEDEVLVRTAERDYTVKDYLQLYQDLGFMDGYHMWQDTKDLIYDLKPPGVEFHCLYGYGVNTSESFVFQKGGFPDYQPDEVFGDGDGTVNLRSLQGCI